MEPWPHRCSAWRVNTALNAGVKFKLADGSAWVWIKRVLGFNFFGSFVCLFTL